MLGSQYKNEISIFGDKRCTTVLILGIVTNLLLVGLLFAYPPAVQKVTPNTSPALPVDAGVKAAVHGTLAGFTGGFLPQGTSGDPSVQYFVGSAYLLVGFGVSSVKLLLTSTTDASTPTTY